MYFLILYLNFKTDILDKLDARCSNAEDKSWNAIFWYYYPDNGSSARFFPGTFVDDQLQEGTRKRTYLTENLCGCWECGERIELKNFKRKVF